jgi:hypothetical protein
MVKCIAYVHGGGHVINVAGDTTHFKGDKQLGIQDFDMLNYFFGDLVIKGYCLKSHRGDYRRNLFDSKNVGRCEPLIFPFRITTVSKAN